jgi:hypothetical protein
MTMKNVLRLSRSSPRPSLKEMLVIALFCANPAWAQVQVRKVSFNSAYQMLNTETAATRSSSLLKSSVSVQERTPYLQAASYNKQFTVFYGVPATVAADWLAMRFAVIMDDDDPEGYWSMTEAQRNAADALHWDDFVPPSAYAAMKVGLDFRFSRPRSLQLGISDFNNYSPVKGRKYFFIR